LSAIQTAVAQPVQVVGDLRGDEQPVTAAKLGDPLAGALELFGPLLQSVVDLGDRRGEPVGVGGQQLLDAGQRHARLGEGLILTSSMVCSAR
jgi:hypothetical protein